MSSTFQDVPYTQAQLDSDPKLHQLDTLNVRTVAVEAKVANNNGDANGNILIGDNIVNVPAVANMVIIGDGDKSNAHAKDILLGDGVTVGAADIPGTLHMGSGMAGVVGDGARASTHHIPIYYNVAKYRLLVSDVAI